MNKKDNYIVDWNPWHGCKKISQGCVNCYVYRGDKNRGVKGSDIVRRTLNFDLPIKKNKNGEYKEKGNKFFYTCFQSDFLVEDADLWRDECFKMMKERSDSYFLFFTKRIERLKDHLPSDWGDGYDNVIIGCTTENQDRADYRLKIFLDLPIKHRYIIVSPMLEKMNIKDYLDDRIEKVIVGGESGDNARLMDNDWVLDIRNQCIEKNVSFVFHQTGAKYKKGDKIYLIKRIYQRDQAKKANLDFDSNTHELRKLDPLKENELQLSLDLFDE